MVPVFNHHDVEVVKQVIDACYAEGIKIFEFTNRGSNAFKVFGALRRYVMQYPDFILGIGTIVHEENTKQFINAGAHFIVSPGLRESMGELCMKKNILWIPGCATMTEILRARDAGAKVIKIFPAASVGPQLVSAVMQVLPDLQLMPTGGIEPIEKELASWFNAGVTAVGLGSQLFNRDLIKDKDWIAMRHNIAQAIEIIQTLKEKKTALAYAKL
jgi:2-dehydro-3-deoxyphosphogluconate aldolase/(4S)-4-hydroxy-2-oxoglutarate aldolase